MVYLHKKVFYKFCVSIQLTVLSRVEDTHLCLHNFSMLILEDLRKAGGGEGANRDKVEGKLIRIEGPSLVMESSRWTVEDKSESTSLRH